MRRVLVGLAVAAAMGATPAAAAIVWNVEGAFTVDSSPPPSVAPSGATPSINTPMAWSTPAGTVTGTFTTNDAVTEVTAIHLVTSAVGAFRSSTYDNVRLIDAQSLPQFFRLAVPVGGTTQLLQIYFHPVLLNATRATSYAFIGYESQQWAGSGSRVLSGTATRAPTAPVPEPQTWALLITGFGLTGAIVRRQRRSAAPA